MKLFSKFKQFSRDIKLIIITTLIMSCFGVYYAYNLSSNNLLSTDGVRPVVSLKANTSYTGTGTLTDPFIVN